MNKLLKLIDFGSSVEFDKGKEVLKTVNGTSYYIAPEVLKKNYDERCDVWSVGVMLYILLSGKPPFDGKNDNEITDKVKKGVYHMSGKIWDGISEQAKNIIKKMLTYNYQERISAREALNDPWFNNAPKAAIDS